MPIPSPITPARKPPRRHLAGEMLRAALEIAWFRDLHGTGPTLIEIARAMGLTTYGGAYHYVRQLKRWGIVRRGLGGWVIVKPAATVRRGTLLTCIGTVT